MSHKRIALVISVFLVGVFPGLSASADTIAIIGTGNVGSALGQRFAELGHTVVYGSRDPSRSDVRDLVASSGENASGLVTSMTTFPASRSAPASAMAFSVPAHAVDSTASSAKAAASSGVPADAPAPCSATHEVFFSAVGSRLPSMT